MLTSKQRAYLRGLANTLDPILHAGKGGISDAMNKQADDALTARELIKGRVLETAPATTRAIAEEIAAAVGAEMVGVIGRTFVLYRRNPKDPVIDLPRA
ncbi:MAG: ribosome assembly RNA-binding protein YhbY [Ruminococcaceae bacterium]|nr:ribosome assembly RNA-binding protein YhbY [Oscillospiraceae bacterium]